ncbi:MAG TPA: outer membrane beta-barrel protein [Cytophagaceae bacterium]|nr:outer membrane beta-barrel protein [Cytophagaceae bacterium]
MMRSFLVVMMMILVSKSLYGQEKYIYGIKINPSAGYLNSPNLNKNLNTQKGLDPQVTRLDAHARLRANFGFGAFFEYRINDKMSALTELTYNFSNTKILINKESSNLDINQSGDITKIASEANIHLSYINLPVLFKYILSQTNRYYLIAGPAINIAGKPFLKSHEVETFTQYTNGTIDNSSITTLDISAKMNKFKTVQFAFVVGAGKIFRFTSGGNNLHIDIRYSLPVSHSAMYSSNPAMDNAMLNNIYGISGKNAAETTAPNYKLNNFKLSVITLSIAYTFKLVFKGKEE